MPAVNPLVYFFKTNMEVVMPRGNGTGPDGRGPVTGRGLGSCFRKRKFSQGSVWGTIFTAIAGAVIKDLSGPSSRIKK